MGRGLSQLQRRLLEVAHADPYGEITADEATCVAQTMKANSLGEEGTREYKKLHSLYQVCQASANRALQRLRQRGLLEHSDYGKYRVPSNEPEKPKTADELAKLAESFRLWESLVGKLKV